MYAAASEPTPDTAFWMVMGSIAISTLIVFFCFTLLLVKQYKRCPPNRLLVIYGKMPGESDRTCKVVHGGAAFIWPLLQDYFYLPLDPVSIELPKELRGLALEKNVQLPTTWSFAVGTTPQLMQAAAARLLGLPREEFERIALDLIAGRIERNVRALDNAVASPDAVVPDAVAIVDKWAEEVDSELAKVGLVTLGYR